MIILDDNSHCFSILAKIKVLKADCTIWYRLVPISLMADYHADWVIWYQKYRPVRLPYSRSSRCQALAYCPVLVFVSFFQLWQLVSLSTPLPLVPCLLLLTCITTPLHPCPTCSRHLLPSSLSPPWCVVLSSLAVVQGGTKLSKQTLNAPILIIIGPRPQSLVSNST